MFTKTYQLDSSKYIDNMNDIKRVVQTLNGVSDVRISDKDHSLTVDFHDKLSEKQILIAINSCKRKLRH